MMLPFDALVVLFTVTNLAFITLVQATPLMRRDVIAPKIITPNADTVWTVGSIERVTWNTSDFPPDSQITNPIGQIILGQEANNSLKLYFEHPLVSGFNLRDGNVSLTVPDVTPRDDYLIVLYGDSGNTSPAFTITEVIPPSSDDRPPPISTASPSIPVTESSSPTSTAPPTLSSTVPTFTSSSASNSSSLAPTAAGSNSSGSSLLTADKSNLMALTLCIVHYCGQNN